MHEFHMRAILYYFYVIDFFEGLIFAYHQHVLELLYWES